MPDISFLPFLFCFYLMGTIPFGLIFTKIFTKQDIRKVGSGNIGATNVLRQGNKVLAFLTLLGDAGKGAAAVLLAKIYTPDVLHIAILLVFLGHLFPVWLKFKGGKGVATYAGIALAYTPLGGMVAILLWGATFFITRISSFSALVATALFPIYMGIIFDEERGMFFLLLSTIVWWTHRTNIKRLLNNEESSFK